VKIMPVTILRSRDGKLDAMDRHALEQLKGRLAANSGKNRVLLHLHGGIVGQVDGEEIAVRLSGTGPLSFQAPLDYEQIYIVWRTGAFETIRTNWMDLASNDRLYSALLKRLIGYVSRKLTVAGVDGRSVGDAMGLTAAEIDRRLKGASDAPFADLDAAAPRAESMRGGQLTFPADDDVEAELEILIAQDSNVTAATEDIAAAIAWDTNGRSALAPHGDAVRGRQSLIRLKESVRKEFGNQHGDAESRGLIGSVGLIEIITLHAVAIAKRIFQRYRDRRDHGIQATIVEELVREFYADLIGSAIWGMMKKDAYDHFQDGGLGLELLDALDSHLERVIVTGHSAGSIWASAMLLALAKPGRSLPGLTLLLLAPAVRMSEFASAISVAGKIGQIRIFTMSDELERRDPVLGRGTGFIYPSSLLYLISGLLEEIGGKALPDAAILGMQRFLLNDNHWLMIESEVQAADAVRAYLQARPDSLVYSKQYAPEGQETDATSHGDFDNNRLTLESVRTFLS
jgi:hypothetical protein